MTTPPCIEEPPPVPGETSTLDLPSGAAAQQPGRGETDAGTRRGFRVPPFYFPPPRSAGPLEGADLVRAWMKSQGFDSYSPMLPDDHMDAAAGVFTHHGGHTETVLALRCLYEWVFFLDDKVFDDRHVEAGQAVDLGVRIQRVLRAPDYRPAPDDSRFVTAAHQAMSRLFAHHGPARVTRFATELGHYLSSTMLDTSACPPDEDRYLTLRLDNFGGLVVAAGIDLSSPDPVPDEQWHAAPVRAFLECATLIGALTNDVISFRREELETGAANNFLTVVRAARGITLPEALTVTMETCDRMTLALLRLRERIAPEPGTPLHNLVERMTGMIRIAIECGLTAPRYNPPPASPPSLADIADTPAYWTNTPTSTSTEPLPYPSIAWWWDHC